MEETKSIGTEPTPGPVTPAVTELRKTVKKVERIGKAKTKKQAQVKIKWSLAAMVAALKVWAQAVLKNFWWKSLKKIGQFFRGFGNMILAFFDLDSKEKVGNLIKRSKSIVRAAGNQALAASLMALLTALAAGVTEAMNGLVEKGGSSVLKKIIHGTMEETLSSASNQESLFKPSESPFNKGASPSWPSHQDSPRFSDPWRRV